MINLFDATLENLDNGLTVGSVFLDISKAFDCVDHSILLHKLSHYGVRGTAYNWIKSYLTNRKQYVNIQGSTSAHYSPLCGVPQGSVLGPLLFLIFINDVTSSSSILSFSMFADDTALNLAIHRDQYELALQTELLKVFNWFEANLLLLNVDKTKYVYFGPNYANKIKQLHQCVPEFLYKKTIQTSANSPEIVENPDVQYLGLTFDNELKFRSHIVSHVCI